MSQDALNIARLLLSNKQENKELALLMMDGMDVKPYDVWMLYTSEMVDMAEDFLTEPHHVFSVSLFHYTFRVWRRTKYNTGKEEKLLFFQWNNQYTTIEDCFYLPRTRMWRGFINAIHVSLNTAYEQRETV